MWRGEAPRDPNALVRKRIEGDLKLAYARRRGRFSQKDASPRSLLRWPRSRRQLVRPPIANGCSRSAPGSSPSRSGRRRSSASGRRRTTSRPGRSRSAGCRSRASRWARSRLWRREPLPGRRDVAAIAVVGLFWFGLYNIALNAAERRVDAGTASMLVDVARSSSPSFAGLVLHEGFPRRLFAGCAVALAGVVVIGTATSDQGVAASWGAVPASRPRSSTRSASSSRSRCWCVCRR